MIRKFVILLVFTIALFLRIYHLGYHDFWYDEVFTVSNADIPNHLLIKKPLFYLDPYRAFISRWVKLFPVSEFNLRLPSMISNFFSVILIFLLGKNLFNYRVGLFSALIMGLSPFHLWYAQEARNYSMSLFLGLFSSYFFFKAINKKRVRFWLLFILGSILAVYINYFFILLLSAQLLYAIIFFKKLKLNFKSIISFLIIGVFFLFRLTPFLKKLNYVWGGFWIPQPNLKSLVITLENFILGYNVNFFPYFIADILIIIFLSRAIMSLKNRDLRPRVFFCLFLCLIPVIFAFVFSKVFFSIYLDRVLIIFSPYFYLILSLGIDSLKRHLKLLTLVILSFFLLISDYAYFKDWMPGSFSHHIGVHTKKPVKPLVNFIKDNLESDDLIAFTNPCIIPPFEFYSKKQLNFYYFFDPRIPDSRSKRPVEEDSFYIPYYKIGNLDFRRLWLIFSNWPRDGSIDENSLRVKEYLDKNLNLKFSKEIEGVRIFRYER